MDGASSSVGKKQDFAQLDEKTRTGIYHKFNSVGT